MDQIKLTIIMSNYNQEQYIEKAIESVLMQNVNFKYKLLITDDFSQKDNSIQIIKDYEKKYPQVIETIYNKENGGYLKNILRAKAVTKTPYFCLLDADDYYTDSSFLQRAYDFLEKNQEYVIYYENVNYLYEDGSESPFINPKEKSRDYDINDYIDDNLPIVQTTGQFYRNVIFSKEIPQIMADAVGTVSERSFEGDYDRFVMHLKYGKAYFNNVICGVYRILSSGIWNKLPECQRILFQLQTYYDYNRYFENKYSDYFINKMYDEFSKLLFLMQNLSEITFSQSQFEQLSNLYNFLNQNSKYITEKNPKKRKTLYSRKLLKNKIKNKLYNCKV